MDFLWFKMPTELDLLRNRTSYQQVKTIVESINTYENLLNNELKKVAKMKAEIAMILVSNEYAEKVLKEKQNEIKGN